MSKTYELWDSATRNLVAACDSEGDALSFVRRYVEEHGSTYASSWVLLWEDESVDKAEQVAEGHGLLALAANSANQTPGLSERRA